MHWHQRSCINSNASEQKPAATKTFHHTEIIRHGGRHRASNTKAKHENQQYWPSATLWTARFSSWHEGKLSSFALVFLSSEYPAFLLVNICEDPCFYYSSSLMDSTLLSIREATKWQPQHRGAHCLGALAHSRSHQCAQKLTECIWNMARLSCNMGIFCGLFFCTQTIKQAINER